MEQPPEPGLRALEDEASRLARERFGLDYLYPIQRFVIANILEAAGRGEAGAGEGGEAPPGGGEAAEEEGLDSPPSRQIVILPTGAGKSLCFQLPALLLEGPSILVFPILALMEDQRRRLEELGLAPLLLRGGQGPEERARILGELASGRSKILIANPEILSLPGLAEALARLGPAQLVIDEAHCVSEWGESFRPSYLELGPLIARLRPRSVSAFTATASPEVLASLARRLFPGEAYRLLSGDPDRPNIAFSVLPCLSRDEALESLLSSLPRPLIVFVSSRKGAERLSALLRERLPGAEVRFYHAGLERAEKGRVEAWFFGSGEGILVATCAYGLGVDKRDIRSVVHYELPGSVEAYLQEAGRAGRDGLPSRAVLIAAPDEEERGSREADPGRRARRAALLAYARSREGCRREALLGLLGARLEGECGGCDRCGGEVAGDFRGAEEIGAFIRAHPRRFDRREARDRLLGRPGREPPLVAGTASLAGWRPEDLEAALSAYLKLGRARIRQKAPWKGRLEALAWPASGGGGLRA